MAKIEELKLKNTCMKNFSHVRFWSGDWLVKPKQGLPDFQIIFVWEILLSAFIQPPKHLPARENVI